MYPLPFGSGHCCPRQCDSALGRTGASSRRLRMGFLSRPANRELKENRPAVRAATAAKLETLVPLTLHADAGPFTKTAACYCVSFSSLLSTGEAALVKYPVGAYVKPGGAARDLPFWERLLAALEARGTGYVNGRFVARDRDGSVWRFTLLFVKRDEDVRANDFGLAHYAARREVCSECLAHRSTRPFTDNRAEALWRPPERMPFLAYTAKMRHPLHALPASVFCCHTFFFPLDVMQLRDSKGVALLVWGSVLLWLLSDHRLGANREARLELVNARRVAFFDAHPGSRRLPKLYINNLTRDGRGNLSSPAFKAATAKHAAPFSAPWPPSSAARSAHLTAVCGRSSRRLTRSTL